MQNGKTVFTISPFYYFTILLFDLGGIDWNRTSDTRIFSPLLYHLSYDAKSRNSDRDGKITKKFEKSYTFVANQVL